MKITTTKQLSPEPEGGNGGAAATVEVVDNGVNVVEQSAQEKNFNALVSAFKEPVQEAIKAEEKKPEGGEEKPVLPEVKAEEKKPEGEVKTPEGQAKPETKPEEKQTELTLDFKIPGEENLPPTTWEALKLKFNLDVKEEKPEAYEQAINKLVEAKNEETRSQTLDKLIEKEPIEIQEAYLFAKHGDAKAINEQLSYISNLKKVDNLTLVQHDLQLKGFDPEAIETKIAKLTEENLIDATAQPLRQLLNEAETATLADKQAFVQSLREKQQNSAIQEKENLANGTSEYFKTLKEFLGNPINDVNKERMQQHIATGIKEGKYSNVLTPAEAAEWHMYKLFGSQAVSNVKTKAFAEGRETKTKDLHNVPPKQEGMNTKSATQQKDNTPFSALKAEFGAIS